MIRSVIRVVGIWSDKVRLGIEARREILVLRGELLDAGKPARAAGEG